MQRYSKDTTKRQTQGEQEGHLLHLQNKDHLEQKWSSVIRVGFLRRAEEDRCYGEIRVSELREEGKG